MRLKSREEEITKQEVGDYNLETWRLESKEKEMTKVKRMSFKSREKKFTKWRGDLKQRRGD